SGLLKSVTGSDNRKFAEFSNYQPSGKPGRVDYGSGSHTIYTYDPTTQRILNIYTEAPTVGALQNRQYTYYKTGDVEAISLDNLNAEFNFTYDSLNRLESVDGNGWGFINYEYDEIGHLLSREVYDNYYKSNYRLFEYQYDTLKPNQVRRLFLNGVSHIFFYDAVGNIVYTKDLSNPENPPERWINYNCFNKPK
ncbi:MAG: hypothetical protein GY850_07985, partial [bacterium]|nr:hypothetical protein [bacterium]